MGMSATRSIAAAHDAYWPSVKLRLLAQGIPASTIQALKDENEALIKAIVTAVIDEITTNAVTKVTENLDATLAALKAERLYQTMAAQLSRPL